MCKLGLGQKCDNDSFQGCKGCQAEGMDLSGEWRRAELFPGKDTGQLLGLAELGPVQLLTGCVNLEN